MTAGKRGQHGQRVTGQLEQPASRTIGLQDKQDTTNKSTSTKGKHKQRLSLLGQFI